MWKRVEEMSFQEKVNAEYSALTDDIKILKVINEFSPKIVDTFKISFEEKLIDRIKSLDDEGIRQLGSFLKKPTDESITFTNPKAIEIYCSFFELFGYPMRIPALIREMSLVYLTSAFESYLENIIALIFSTSPETLKSTKTITHEELVELAIRQGTMKDLMNILAGRDIKSIMREGIDKILKTLFSERFKLDVIMSESSVWRQLKETFFRRDIIVHNHGNPDLQYRDKSGYKGPQKPIFIEKRYLAKRFDTFQRCSEFIRDTVNDKFGTEKKRNQPMPSFEILSL